MSLIPLVHLAGAVAAPFSGGAVPGLAPVLVEPEVPDCAVQDTEPAELDASTWRYETGRRMRAMERAWATAEEAQRAAAVAAVERSVGLFFRANMAGVARELDGARRLLDAGAGGDRSTELERAGNAFAMIPAARLVAEGTETLRVRVAPIYGSWDFLDEASVTLSYFDPATAKRHSVEGACGANGTVLRLGLGSHSSSSFAVEGKLRLGDNVISIGTLRFEIVANLQARLAALRGRVGRRSELPRTIAAQTAHQYLGLLEDMASGKIPETDYLAAELLELAELLAGTTAEPDGAGEPESGASSAAEWISSPGERWLSVPIGRRTVNVRVLVPEGIEPGARVPLVVALHGAGGSHNMFFDGYGDGLAVDLAQARGWALISPQVGFLGCPVVKIIDALSARLPVDLDQVVVLGHSMGAGAAIRAANGAPDRFRAIAALGGGGKATAAMASIPAFLGAGATDFGKGGVDSLAGRLRALGAKESVHRTYDNTEHLLIVQRALPDVFAFFDSHLGGR